MAGKQRNAAQETLRCRGDAIVIPLGLKIFWVIMFALGIIGAFVFKPYTDER